MLLFIFSLTYFSIDVSGQSMCPIDRFEFEIEKVPPASPWRVNSTTSIPGAFHAFYRVKLKTKAGQPPFPASFIFNYLQFEGVIKVNNFTSRINTNLTIQFSQTPYLQYLDTNPNTLLNGEIVWNVGSENNCEPGGGGVGVELPLPLGETSVTLFTICIEALPGDQLRWNSSSAYVDQCTPNTTCDGPMGVVIAGGSTVINFPPPSPGLPTKTLIYEYAYDAGLLVPFVRVAIKPPLAASGHFAKVDGSIHIIPEMATANLDLIPSNISGGPVLNRAERRKNADGSFDIYFAFEDFPHPDSPALDPSDTLYVLAIQLNGIYNLSQGGILHCSLNAGRWVSGALANNAQTYQLISTTTDINIPGHEPCDYNLKITGSTYDSQNCSGGIRFRLLHDRPTPMSLKFLKLELIYDQSAAGSATPGTPTSNLPDAANSGDFYLGPDNSTWIYAYEKQAGINDSILIENGMYVDVPFDIDHNCVRYLVTVGEADPSPGSGSSYCALEVALGEDLCDPEAVGSIFLPNQATAPYCRVNLKDFNSPYDDEETNFCEPTFSFCPDQSQAPFFLEVETNPDYVDDYLCANAENSGITTYDFVLIQKHLKGTLPFTSVYQRIAADANKSYSIESTIDVPEFRKLILGVYDNMDADPTNDWPTDNAPSWLYFRESLNLPVDSIRSIVPNTSALTTDTCHVPINGIGNYGNFYAVKLGDVNFTCNCNNLRPINGSQVDSNTVRLITNDAEIRQDGNAVFVPVYADSPFGLIALQGGFRFDPSTLSLSEVLPNPELPIYPFHFGLSKKEDGEIRFAWSPELDLTPLPGNSLLFTLKFERKSGVSLPKGPFFWASDNIMKSLAYQDDGTEYPMMLTWESVGRDRAPSLGLVVNPNPFKESLTAFVYSEKVSKGTLRLSDNRGTVYAQQALELQAGDNAVEIRLSTLAQPGVYLLSIEVEGQRLQRRVVKI